MRAASCPHRATCTPSRSTSRPAVCSPRCCRDPRAPRDYRPRGRPRITAGDDPYGTSNEGPSLVKTTSIRYFDSSLLLGVGARRDRSRSSRARVELVPSHPATASSSEALDHVLPSSSSSSVAREGEEVPPEGARIAGDVPSNVGESIPAKRSRSTRRSSFFCGLPLWKRGRMLSDVEVTTNVTHRVAPP